MANACEAIAAAALRNKWFDCDLEFDSLESAFDDVAKQCESVLGGLEGGRAPVYSLRQEGAQSPDGEQGQSKEGHAGIVDPQVTIKKLEEKIGKNVAQELIKAFLEDTDDSLQTIASAIQRQDAPTAQKAAHKLAGCCASIMDIEGQRLAKAVENLAIKQSWKSVDSVFLTLSNSVSRTRNALREYCKKWWKIF
jgi:HPt (histidine-containing phosphotransfer) domain-containing protein